MSSSVWVLCPNGHRVSVSCGSNTPLNTIKQQACEKQGFDPTKYGLRKEDMKKGLDLSLPFRLSGLANKAKLELFEEAQKSVKVNVALQLDTGGRVMGQVSNTATIAQTIQSVGTDIASASVAIYLQRKISSDEFEKTTLLDLGVFKGSVMLRLQGVVLKSTQTESANDTSVPKHTTETPAGPKPEPKPEQEMETETSIMSIQENSVHNTVSEMEVEEAPVEENDSETDPIVIRQTKSFDSSPILFNPVSQSNTESQKEEPDDFYVVTDRDLKSMLRDLHKISEQDFRFREPEKEKSVPNNVVMRIRFPNGLMLQSVFETKISSTDSLYTFVSGYLTEESAEHVILYQAPPKRVIKRGLTLQEAGLTSTTLLHAGGDITLKNDLLVQSDSVSAMEQLSGVVGRPESRTQKKETVTQSAAKLPGNASSASGNDDGGNQSKGSKPVPKWFKLK